VSGKKWKKIFSLTDLAVNFW